MEDKDYKVVQVSSKEPKRWDGPNGTVYYINVKLEGHDKPVSVGKKSPDALKPGDTVYGHILVEQSYEEDKFKAGKKAFGGQQSFGGGKSNYTPRDDDAIRAQWAIGQTLQYMKPTSGDYEFTDKTEVVIEAIARKLYSMVDRVKGSSEGTNPKVPVTKSPAVTTSNPARLKHGQAVWPSDDNDPEFASLLAQGLQAEGIPTEEIPEEWR